MGFLQHFHLVIIYKMGIQHKAFDMLFRPPANASIVLQHNSIDHDNYVEQYTKDEEFKDVGEPLTHGNHME